MAVRDFKDRFDGSLKLVWADDTGGTGSPSANDIVAHITQGFSNIQLAAISKVESTDDIPNQCPQNFNLFSECFAGLSFGHLPSGPNDTRPINYTILGNGGFGYINAIKHTSDYELYVLPLQWAVDQVVMKGTPARVRAHHIVGHNRTQDRSTSRHPFRMAVQQRDQPRGNPGSSPQLYPRFAQPPSSHTVRSSLKMAPESNLRVV